MQLRLPKHSLTAPREIVFFGDDALAPEPKREEFADEEQYDDALKQRREAYAEYQRTWRASHLPVKPGRLPVVFVVKPLTLAQARWIEGRQSGDQQFDSIAYGVHDIRNLLDEDGQPVTIKRIDTDLGPKLDDVALALFLDPDLRDWIFRAVRGAIRLTPEARKSD